MMKNLLTTAALAAATLTLCAAPAHAVDGGPDGGCDPTAPPTSVVTVTDRINDLHWIVRTATVTTSCVQRITGPVVLTGQTVLERKTTAPERGCKIMKRRALPASEGWTRWRLVGTYQPCGRD